ncbi:hypothetical protein VHEMI08075 [[Torrubiella] hemipterigena]|uniref:Uncharacterized protein n=1 Tax=[Torrubiella] hemipterigena TaxID=1531966 RepID=A0A0A1T5H5_9HYPO|nr:hypothetical protein VHEMI08075 [[Torrubiella] hemipterigena]
MSRQQRRVTRQSAEDRKAQYFRLPLPPCKGPKLHAFRQDVKPIKWLSRLDSHNYTDADRGEVPFTYVFKVEIDSTIYALKVFDFFHVEDYRRYWGNLMPESYPVETIRLHTDPFYAECRAYGRIMETEAKRPRMMPICVPCYGYMMLSEEDRHILETRFYLAFDDIHSRREPLRALVKQYAGSDPGITEHSLTKTRQRMKNMNKLGIYNRDIGLDNFLNGLLIDFDNAWTEPHCFIQDMPRPHHIQENKDYDKYKFDEMLKCSGFSKKYSFYPNAEFCTKLRSNVVHYYSDAFSDTTTDTDTES